MLKALIELARRSENIIHVILLTLLYILLDFEYRTFVAPLFFHLNFTYDFFLWRSLLAALLFILAMSSILYMKTTPYLHATSMLFIVFILMPNLILFKYMETNPAIPLIIFAFIILLRIRINLRFLVDRLPVIPRQYSTTILLVTALLFLLPIITQFGFRLHNGIFYSDTSVLYDIRSGVNEQVNLLSAYSFGQLTKAVFPVMLLYGIVMRKFLISILALIGTGYIFMVNPHKTYLIAVLPILFFALFREYPKKITFFLGLFILLIFATMVFSSYGNILPESLAVRRSLFTQAFLTHAYFDFFEGNPMMLSHSFLSGLTNYPYDLSPPFLIGSEYFDSPVMSCNTGFIGDGFMNFGYAGTLVYTLIAASVFHLLNNLRLNPAYYGLTFLIIFQMQNSYLFTLFITHGLLLLLLIMVFVIRNRTENE